MYSALFQLSTLYADKWQATNHSSTAEEAVAGPEWPKFLPTEDSQESRAARAIQVHMICSLLASKPISLPALFYSTSETAELCRKHSGGVETFSEPSRNRDIMISGADPEILMINYDD